MSQLTQSFSSRNAILAFITRPLAPPPPLPAGARLRCPQAAAMSRAMAMTALIDKLTSRPFVYFEMFHPIPRERRRQRLTRYGNAVVSGCGARALAAEPRTGSASQSGLGDSDATRLLCPDCGSRRPARQPRIARNWNFESSSLQQRDAMGRAARMAISSLTSIDGVPRCLSRTI